MGLDDRQQAEQEEYFVYRTINDMIDVVRSCGAEAITNNIPPDIKKKLQKSLIGD